MNIIVRDYDRAAFPETFVTAGVVTMPMGIDHEAHRLRVQARHSSGNLVGERRKLVIHQDVAVLAVRQANISA